MNQWKYGVKGMGDVDIGSRTMKNEEGNARWEKKEQF